MSRQEGTVSYIRVYSDTAGDSHFEEVEVDFKPIDVAPPAPPVNVAAAMASERMMLVSCPQDGTEIGIRPHGDSSSFSYLASLNFASATAEFAPSLLERSSFWKTYRAKAT